MTTPARSRELRLVPIDRIDVLNPRERSPEGFSEIVENIRAIGLKKPISVTPRAGDDGAERFLLVCGEGRLKAFKELGETRIPALVIAASDEDAFIMSITENIARRRYRALEQISGIARLHNLGYSASRIAEKTGLSPKYASSLVLLIEHGEERLLAAVQQGRIPVTVAVAIAGAGDSDKAVQEALQEAYESGDLRGSQLMDARKLIQSRQLFGRSAGYRSLKKSISITSTSLVRAYQKEVQRQTIMVRRAMSAQERLLFITGALRQLIADDSLITLLRAEGLDTLPKYLGDRIAEAHL
ncbi:MAG: ParB/RepB/Spo0J family partition protein [Alphaproteobacteria bacterium]|nr:MAG: ParB/RepB/Spo0J family partition protein [Alphaproteobacteria bacterium]